MTARPALDPRRGRPLRLADRAMHGFIVSFTAPRGRFDTAVVVVDRGRALVTLTVLGRAGDVEARDVQSLAAKARARLR